jgi:hypothetical protein
LSIASRPFGLAAGLMSLALGGCLGPATSPSASPSPTPTAVVQGLASEGLRFTLTVYDDWGHITGAEIVPADITGIPLTLPAMEGITPVQGRAESLYIGWVSRPCEDRPSLTVSPEAEAPVHILNRGPAREGACPDYATYFAVRVDFDTQVDAGSTGLEVVNPPE